MNLRTCLEKFVILRTPLPLLLLLVLTSTNAHANENDTIDRMSRTSAKELLDAASAIKMGHEWEDPKKLCSLYLQLNDPDSCLNLFDRNKHPGRTLKKLCPALQLMAEMGRSDDANRILNALDERNQTWFRGRLQDFKESLIKDGRESIQRGRALRLASQKRYDEAIALGTNIYFPAYLGEQGQLVEAYTLWKKNSANPITPNVIEQWLLFTRYSDNELARWLSIVEETDAVSQLFRYQHSNVLGNLRRRNRIRAISLIDEWAVRNEKLTELCWRLADVYLDLKQTKRGNELLDIATELKPDGFLLVCDLARIEHKHGRVQRAQKRLIDYEADFDKEVEQASPPQNSYYRRFAAARMDVGLFDNTQDYVSKIEPDSSEGDYLRFQLLVHDHEFEYAKLKAVFPRRLLFGGRTPERYRLVAEIATHGGAELAARLIREQKTTDEFKDCDFGCVLAELLKMRNDQVAVEFANEIVASQFELTSDLLERVHAIESVDLKDWKRLKATFPSSALIANQIAMLHVRNNDLGKAIAALREHKPNETLKRIFIDSFPIEKAIELIEPSWGFQGPSALAELLVEDPTDVKRVLDFAKHIQDPNERFRLLESAAEYYISKHIVR